MPAVGGAEDRNLGYCEQLELGNILFFAKTPFEISEEDRCFLLGQRQTGASYHKNIAYRPKQDRLTGSLPGSRENEERLRAVMRRYSRSATQFVSRWLPQYTANWREDFASFRPLEEQGRQLRVRARNDLLHVDSFPTRPTHGDRILRIFTNINPTQPRVWLTSDTFEECARRFLGPQMPADLRPALKPSSLGTAFARVAGTLRLPVADPSPYDRFMLRLHHYLKENREFQETCPKSRWEFPPDSTWLVFTDMVTHAVLAGRFALEQTFIVARRGMVLPDKAPVAILETFLGNPI